MGKNSIYERNKVIVNASIFSTIQNICFTIFHFMELKRNATNALYTFLVKQNIENKKKHLFIVCYNKNAEQIKLLNMNISFFVVPTIYLHSFSFLINFFSLTFSAK